MLYTQGLTLVVHDQNIHTPSFHILHEGGYIIDALITLEALLCIPPLYLLVTLLSSHS
jgi:hypothetical protein